MAKNGALNKAGKVKEDEFYTQISDIERELKHYKNQLYDKVIFCNCDDPAESNFFKYFQLNFYVLGIKKLICTHFDREKPTYKLEITSSSNNGQMSIPDYVKTDLKGNGDFRSPECIEILKEADIVITNPPFSLFHDFLKILLNYDKKFLIIGSQNNITYKDTFPLLRDNKVWLGYYAGDMAFKVPDYYEPRETRFWIDESGQKWRSFGNMCWFTNLDIAKRHEDLITPFKKYNENDYQFFDNYDAIFIEKLIDIPIDYNGVMGVPITFLYKHNPDKYEIIGLLAGNIKGLAGIPSKIGKDGPYINGKLKYGRILIRRKQ